MTATPHSGIEESFRSLLGLVDSEFARFDLHRLIERDRDRLARHFVQRRRADVVKWLGEETPFPKREAKEEHYNLSRSYHELFDKVYEFSRELVRAGESLTGWKQRIRYWSALALLRCVMSSPAAAIAAIEKRKSNLVADEEATDETYAPFVYDPTEDQSADAQPAHIVSEGETSLTQSERNRLRDFARLAQRISNSDQDNKLTMCIEIVRSLLKEGHHPIVWCRYIATSDYVSARLARTLGKEFDSLRVVSITGALADEERREIVEDLSRSACRVLVATDCLSEGINLQEFFSAVIHYDLPWNPNRLEQREGRVDRFGQTHSSGKVKAVLLYGRDNPIDGAVLDVLLRKARDINRALGITVPVPANSDTVMEAVLKALFFRSGRVESQQLTLFEDPFVTEVHRRWEESASREEESRTRFAQRAIKPEEVQRELEEADSVLGDPEAVSRFVMNSCQRLGLSLRQSDDGCWLIHGLDRLPELVRSAAPEGESEWRISFTSPTPPDMTYLGRNHPFVAGLAQYLLEESLTKSANARAARCGVIRTKLINRRTVMLLLKLRFTVKQHGGQPMLSEEVFACGYRSSLPDRLEWIEEAEARRLVEQAADNISANVSPSERREILKEILSAWQRLQPELNTLIDSRAARLADAHARVRASLRMGRSKLSVEAHQPPDLLGVLVLLPVPKGVAR